MVQHTPGLFMNRCEAFLNHFLVSEDETLRNIRKRCLEKDLPIHIAPYVGHTMACLLSLSGARKVLEIGTHAGYSTLWMARAVGMTGQIHTFEKCPKRAMLAKETFDDLTTERSCIHFHTTSLQQGLKILEKEGPFDAMFMDANKREYLEYLILAEPFLKKGALIFADDIFLFGDLFNANDPPKMRPSTQKNMMAFLEHIKNQHYYEPWILPSSHGLLVVKKDF